MLEQLKKIRQYLLTGVSFAIPFIACGGILIAFAIAAVPMGPSGPDFSASPMIKLILDIGSAAFALMLPVLAGYISYAIANKPGLVGGFVGGYVAGQIGAGFLGALVAGLLAGYLVQLIKKAKVPRYIAPIMPILIIPLLSSLVIGVVMYKVIGTPIASLMVWLGDGLKSMSAGNVVLLAAVLGSMIAFDMGGPINKVAFFFGAAMIKEGNYLIMGCVATAICIPPLGMGLATLIAGKLWDEEQKKAGIAALAMGMIGITEGAIPFAAGDPLRVIPSIVVGSTLGAVIAALGGVGDHAPHGGPIVLPVVDNRLIYLLAIVVGSLLTALMVNLLKRWGNKKGTAAVAAK